MVSILHAPHCQGGAWLSLSLSEHVRHDNNITNARDRDLEMIVFDVDGTLVGGERTDWKCFDDAFEEAAGFPFPSGFFERIEEVTARAIVHQALHGYPEDEKRRIEACTCQGFRRRLEEAHREDRNAFPAIHGAASLIEDIQQRGIPLAIATGDWMETITFKLEAAELSVEGIPMVTSSHCYSRAEIIRAAVREAGGRLSHCVYVGDGHWDLRACQKLGIAFIGCGNKKETLEAGGAQHLVESLGRTHFWVAFERISFPNACAS